MLTHGLSPIFTLAFRWQFLHSLRHVLVEEKQHLTKNNRKFIISELKNNKKQNKKFSYCNHMVKICNICYWINNDGHVCFSNV
jgi:hypothetical protein